jgi:serine protease inhibitor
LEVVLALAYMGAAGSTAEEIAAALYLPPDKEDIEAGFMALLHSLKVRRDPTAE